MSVIMLDPCRNLTRATSFVGVYRLQASLHTLKSYIHPVVSFRMHGWGDGEMLGRYVSPVCCLVHNTIIQIM